MKKMCLVSFVCLFIFAVVVWAKQPTVVNLLAKVAVSSAGGGAVSTEAFVNPLDGPFQPKHTYPGTNVPTNVVPIASFIKGNHVCGSFRINKNWLLTAAHCLEHFGTKNQRISFSIHKGDNGVFEVQFRSVDRNNPANADVFFYRQGYSSNENHPRIAYSHAEDIALVRLEEKEKNVVVRNRQEALATLDSFSALAVSLDEENLRPVKAARKKLIAAPKDHKEFFNRPLNKYTFFTIPPEGVFHFMQHAGNIFEFRAYEDHAQTFHRDSPRVHVFRFKGTEGAGSHELLWNFAGDDIGTSGSPIIINGFVVSNTSGPKGKGVRATPLYAPQFHKFLQNAMGKEYPKGLCLTPNLPPDMPKWEPKK